MTLSVIVTSFFDITDIRDGHFGIGCDESWGKALGMSLLTIKFHGNKHKADVNVNI